MSWEALNRFGATVRPFSGVLPPRGRKRSRFQAGLPSTLKQLKVELRQLNAKNTVIEIDVRDRDIRIDGYPRADARAPATPGVAISFDSKHGPLRYATAEYDSWHDNLRAIALSMEALRAVDRYGVSKRGEQYQGWKALPQSTDPVDSIRTVEDAQRVIAQAAGLPPDTKLGVLEPTAIKAALRASHPDTGGSTEAFRLVMRAKELLS